MIGEYTDCLSKSIILQGRTSNGTLINTETCSGFGECTQKFCEIANNSRVDWTCFLLESSNSEKIYYYNNNTVYLLVSIILFLFVVSIILSLLLCLNKRKLSKMNEMLYEKVSPLKNVNYGDDFNTDENNGKIE